MSHFREINKMEAEDEVINCEKLEKNVACSLISNGPKKIPFLRMVTRRYDLRRMSELLHQHYRACSTFSEATLHSSLARIRYTAQALQCYIAK